MFGQNRYDTGVPIYIQIIQRIRKRIVSGEWQPGRRMAGVRELAMEYGVNPNTMQRSLLELEQQGLVFAQRTAGRYITDDVSLIDAVRESMAEEIIEAFLVDIFSMGYTEEQIKKQLESALADHALRRKET